MTPRFPALRFLIALKAARDFGLPQHHADEIALRFNARHESSHEDLVEALAQTLLKSGAVRVPTHA
jgi:hypothetical protein